MKKQCNQIILLGAVWGIFEATAGHLIHLSGLRIGSFLWFPIAYFFIHTAYRATGSFPAAMATAGIASSLKLLDLFLPGRVDLVVNPAVAILLEALAIVLVYKYVIDRQMDRINPLTIALTGFLWRGLYVCYLFLMPRAYFDISSLVAMESFLQFMFVKNLVNITIISAGFPLARALEKRFGPGLARLREAAGRRIARPPLAAGALALAAAVQVLLG